MRLEHEEPRRAFLRRMALIIPAAGLALSRYGRGRAQFPTPDGRSKKIELGVFAGDESKREEVEKELGFSTRIISTFAAFGDEINPAAVEAAKKRKAALWVFWEGYTSGRDIRDDPEFNNQSFVDGLHDETIRQFGQACARTDLPTLVYPFPEANLGTAQTENINGNKGDFRKAVDHVAKTLGNVKNVTVGLALNIQTDPSDMDTYNADLAQVIGLDGFNFGGPQEPWMSFDTLFRPSLDEVQTWGKPMTISSMGCAPGEKRVEWWEGAIKTMFSGRYNLDGINIFAENKAGGGDWERDWSLDAATISVLKTRFS